MPITVAIVEDNEEISTMLASVIAREPKLNCVCTCPSGELALEALPRHRPEVVIMDIQLPGLSGIQCTARLRQVLPQTQVLVYTVYGDSEQVFKALKAGASGYLLKRSTQVEILEAIFDVQQGGAPMSGEIARKVVRSFAEPVTVEETRQLTAAPGRKFSTPRARVCHQGNRQQLNISFDTVRYHLKDIYTKLHVRSKTEAVLKYLK